jgi:hypothetical protein
MAKYAVFITYGVYVDTDYPLTEENEYVLEAKIYNEAIAKLQQATTSDLLNADFEIEDVTEEFAQQN